MNFKEKIEKLDKPTVFPPENLLNEYTMSWKVPVSSLYFDNTVNAPTFFSKKDVDKFMDICSNRGTNYYGDIDLCLYNALKDYPIQNKEVAIMGSETPWYESICLTYGGKPTTIEYNKIVTDDDRLNVMTVEEYDRNPKQFDMAFSISSFEHDGLGRYGDTLCPDGDLNAMKKMKNTIKKNGTMFLSVPYGQDELVWNAHRIYGHLRFPLLIEGWVILREYSLTTNPERLFVLKNI